MGLGMALHEESVMDREFGDYLNHDLAQYHFPANADVQEIDAVWIDEDDAAPQPDGLQGHRRDRHRRHRGGDRQRGLPRHRRARPRAADPARPRARPVILITGATGNIGGATLEALAPKATRCAP